MFVEQAFSIFVEMEFKERPRKIGYIKKTHGVRGGLVLETSIELFGDQTLPFWIFIELDGGLIPYQLDTDNSFIRDNKHLVIFLKEIDSPEKAARFLDASIYFPEDFVTVIAGSDTGLRINKGYHVIFEGHRETGIFKELIEIPGNPVMSIDVNGKEILVPANEEFIISQDDGLKTIHLRVPDELLDLN